MDVTTFFALAGFVTATTLSPGPNSVMIMASGVNFGFSRTIPHILGVATGVTSVITLVGFGLAQLLEEVPFLRSGLLVLSTAYLLYLAWKIANVAPPKEGLPKGAPLSFSQAATFQCVNSKVWALGLSAATFYVPHQSILLAVIVALTFGIVGLISNSMWAWSGTVLRKWLSHRRYLRVFNITMAILLVSSLYSVFMQ